MEFSSNKLKIGPGFCDLGTRSENGSRAISPKARHHASPVSRKRRWLSWALVASLLLPASGCVRRRLTVRTNPPGAAVYVDQHPIGNTPVSVPFTYYGTRSIEVIRDGYRTEKVLRTISPPWYEIPPLDFVTETLWPWEVRDERIIDIEMIPEPIVASQELMARADELRRQAAEGVAVSLPPPAINRPAPVIIPPSNLPPMSTLPPGSVYPPNSSPIPIVPSPAPNYVPSPPLQSGTSGLPAWQPGSLNPAPVIQGLVLPGGQPPTSLPNVGIPGAGFRPPVEGTPSPAPTTGDGDWQDN